MGFCNFHRLFNSTWKKTKNVCLSVDLNPSKDGVGGGGEGGGGGGEGGVAVVVKVTQQVAVAAYSLAIFFISCLLNCEVSTE